ncbi:hypothetical protein AAC387_Pa09g0431 [Persea americana]
MMKSRGFLVDGGLRRSTIFTDLEEEREIQRGFPLGRRGLVDLWPEWISGFRQPRAGREIRRRLARAGDLSHVRGKGNPKKGFSSWSVELRRSVAGEHLWILSTSSWKRNPKKNDNQRRKHPTRAPPTEISYSHTLGDRDGRRSG